MQPFNIQLKVRDYECDIQGVVNNAVYLNYLEHARHEFLLAQGLDFHQLCREGVNLMVLRTEIDYKGSLRSGDEFVVDVSVERQSRLKFDFKQNIYRAADQKLLIKAVTTGTGVNAAGRPFMPAEIANILEKA